MQNQLQPLGLIKRALAIIIGLIVLILIGASALKYFLGQQYLDQENRNFQLLREKSKLDCKKLPIHCAVRDKDLALLNGIALGNDRIESLDGWSRTPLYLAITLADKEAVKILLDKGANPNVFDEYGRPALLASIEKNLYEVTEDLIDHGAKVDVEVKDIAGTAMPPSYSPLGYCITNNDLKCVELLLEHGSNVDRKSSHQAIIHNSLVNKISIYEMAIGNDKVSAEMKQLLKHTRDKAHMPVHSGLKIPDKMSKQ